jgi:hypothetical protein
MAERVTDFRGRSLSARLYWAVDVASVPVAERGVLPPRVSEETGAVVVASRSSLTFDLIYAAACCALSLAISIARKYAPMRPRKAALMSR